MHKLNLDKLPENRVNYYKLGARPKTKLKSRLKNDSSALRKATGKISHQNLVIDEGCIELSDGYLKQLTVWFDGRNEINGNPAIMA